MAEEYASKGVANAGLTTGIIGTALGVLNGSNNSNGLLGGLFGGNCNNTNTLAGLGAVAELGKKDAEIAQLKAEKYADGVGINTFKEVLGIFEKKDEKYATLFENLNKEAVDNRVRLAQLGCEIDKVKTNLEGAIALEAERRAAGDQNLYCYVNATFVPGKLVMPLDSLCPGAMPRYNAWEAPTATQTTPAPATK